MRQNEGVDMGGSVGMAAGAAESAAADVSTGAARLRGEDLCLGYGDVAVARDLNVAIPDGSFTVIVGANGCGKSTLLRGLARLLSPASGRVLLDGRDIAAMGSRDFARELALLPQSPHIPEGITVAELVGRGRYPHQGVFSRPSKRDEEAVARALAATGTADFADALLGELSGGERQRVWVAMVLAQDTPIIFLDEPTTYLDIAFQIELLDLCARLNREGRTLVAVLHDLNQAARYASHVIAMKDGRIVFSGSAGEVFTPENIAEIYGLTAVVIPDPVTGTPMVVPVSARS
ncbi:MULTISPECIES: ABC transporter ATP-binding protein [Actinotignum]|uniref:ABC transporter ATP-binding protein n=1 Tax=Actinotignum timonense TaxID=1870995 RepID=A0AAW9HCQ2_9ACTO|nr:MULTISPECIES: ABC transporter ATP-binding protein [Actinotignum]MBS5748301.1 ABC transporter ATP-binding protein [Actinotignum schaalii]MDE1557838.1 ABC transporter ATP-binding protein [Actinotignum schaalii]MDE1663217.1 ABC transporter ATP-binding protein [Actinotignum schaalii]MDK6373577.1 ABC transporter ATP-binding protein [Actinotignum timonense]MDK6418910.1 ABC transporter ATP-binding protein [Actinotignum timonense]